MTNISPCKRNCELTADNSYCLSCLRTIEEISNWEKFSKSEKKSIINSLKLRKRKL